MSMRVMTDSRHRVSCGVWCMLHTSRLLYLGLASTSVSSCVVVLGPQILLYGCDMT